MRISLIAIALTASTASADNKTIGIDGGLALPTGTWGDGAGIGIGALGRFEMPLAPKLSLTARAGVVYHMSKDSGDMGGGGSAQATEIPFLGGVRYAFADNPASSFYLAAEMGLVVAMVSVDFDGMSMSDSKTNFGMTLGAGYRSGKLDLRGGLFMPDLGHAGDAIGLMATVGYDVASL